ncbi:MAG: DNA polymerase III subunit gamma/tau [Saprospiraceae bacterium]|nr:DNA polymerase III subunit gamma/tau [Saprospiraceae bacterium]
MGNFVVSARKYRPMRFEDVVGQKHISQTLKNALHHDHLAHAFLFCGPRGVGKTTCARILAKVINCENSATTHEPCNKCNSCASFNENASFNIVELDAASNNSVDNVRILIDQVRFQPQQGKYRVFIIDEVHMLSQAAFNAFLKTLEEPPPHAIFILATTEKHKIIPTILSRCQIFDFRRIQIQDIVEHLQFICEKENIRADVEALHVIAQKADGALRDALSIFDRVISSSFDHIDYQDVIENLNVLDYDYYFRVIDAILTEDVANVYLIFDEVLKKGFEAELFISGLGEHIRNLLMCKNEETLSLLEMSDSVKGRFLTQSKLIPMGLLLGALDAINVADINFRMARNKRLHVEMLLSKLTFLQRITDSNRISDETPEKKNEYPKVKQAPPPLAATVNEEKKILKPSNEPQEIGEKVAISNNSPQKEAADHPRVEAKKISHDVAVTPTLNSLAVLTHQIKKQSDHEQLTEIEFNKENVMLAWEEYATGVTSPSLKNAMNTAEINVKSKKIAAIVESKLLRNILIAESNLMDFMRKKFNIPGLTLSITVDSSKMGENTIARPIKALSSKERLEKMITKNPLVLDLLNTLDLKQDT